jgi:5-methylcytosine-specific restriction protein A
VIEALFDKSVGKGLADGSTKDEADEADEHYPEGRELMRLHRQKERNRKAVARKKEKVLAATGKLVCEVCDFDFAEAYGELGNGFAECHHRTPLAELTEEYHIKLGELAIVCANCHRMLHRRPLNKVEELRQLVLSRR